ncbi:hypothetical protein GALL_366570 [mine drainage metagenome]|uniref:Uncharacterized protein n=1 Tax=mine drainage metagenome TaxID=410659 RepID=A0A1J5R077_9ZZZZ
MNGVGKVIQNFAPRRILGGTAAMALIDHNQIEKVPRNCFVYLVVFIRTGERLIEAQVDFVRWINLAIFYLGHHRTKRLEIIYPRLVCQDISIYQEQYPLHCLGFPQPPDDLEGGVGFTRAGGHDQQNAPLPVCYRFDGSVYRL